MRVKYAFQLSANKLIDTKERHLSECRQVQANST